MKITYAATKHFWERMRERELPYQQIADAIERGDKRPRYGQENLFLHINQSVTVVTHEIGRTCTLITAYKTTSTI